MMLHHLHRLYSLEYQNSYGLGRVVKEAVMECIEVMSQYLQDNLTALRVFKRNKPGETLPYLQTNPFSRCIFFFPIWNYYL